MLAARTSWRVLVAILQIAALIAFQVPAAAHSGSTHASPGLSAQAHLHTEALSSEASHHHIGATATAFGDPADDGESHGACCLGCCSCSCHAFGSGPDIMHASLRYVPARALPLASDRPVPSVTLEALPEPPRPFA